MALLLNLENLEKYFEEQADMRRGFRRHRGRFRRRSHRRFR